MRFLSLLFSIVFIAGCSSFNSNVPEESFQTAPTLAPVTDIGEIITLLPPARDKITLSVYEFTDQTGQNKPSDKNRGRTLRLLALQHRRAAAVLH